MNNLNLRTILALVIGVFSISLIGYHDPAGWEIIGIITIAGAILTWQLADRNVEPIASVATFLTGVLFAFIATPDYRVFFLLLLLIGATVSLRNYQLSQQGQSSFVKNAMTAMIAGIVILATYMLFSNSSIVDPVEFWVYDNGLETIQHEVKKEIQPDTSEFYDEDYSDWVLEIGGSTQPTKIAYRTKAGLWLRSYWQLENEVNFTELKGEEEDGIISGNISANDLSGTFQLKQVNTQKYTGSISVDDTEKSIVLKRKRTPFTLE